MSQTVTDRVIAVIAATQKISAEKIRPESTFQELGIDSLDGINILFALENEFDINIPDDSARSIRTVSEMIDGVDALLNGKAQASAG
jgi:acyl carrier protein